MLRHTVLHFFRTCAPFGGIVFGSVDFKSGVAIFQIIYNLSGSSDAGINIGFCCLGSHFFGGEE
jgi:hypothetical protein